jgi:hypothetical protein
LEKKINIKKIEELNNIITEKECVLKSELASRLENLTSKIRF